MRKALALTALSAALAAGPAAAHHSFAVFFDEEQIVEVTGEVTEFQYRNPHGTIEVTVEGEGGPEAWKAETNSPSVLRRRGWDRDSLKPGDMIVMRGWPARDGSNYMRMQQVTHQDGTPVGRPFAFSDD